MNKREIYLYGFVLGYSEQNTLSFLGNDSVYFIPYKSCSAVVAYKEKIDLIHLDRESLAYLLLDHQKTIESFMCNGYKIIPMKLGAMLKSREDVIELLENGYDIIIDTLHKIENIEEIDLVVTWCDFVRILNEVADSLEILEIKENIAKKGVFDENDRISIGMLVKKKIKEKNNKINLKIIDLLKYLSIAFKLHESINDEMIINSAFLIKKENNKDFIKAIESLNLEYSDLLIFKIVGPLPCYSFYALEIKEIKSESLRLAKNVLGINEVNTKEDIKRAYRYKANIAHPDKKNGLISNYNNSFSLVTDAYKTLIESFSLMHKLSLFDNSPDKNNINKSFFIVQISN